MSDDPGETERETGVTDENDGILDDRPVFGEAEESLDILSVNP
jgi:hypothetical protein